MITIQNLEINFDVEGDDDEQAFARLFSEYIRKWATQVQQQREADQDAQREGSLVNTPNGDGRW
jgi:hypothetical protein